MNKNTSKSKNQNPSKKRYYIAYGSNLSVAQMAVRCPGAKIAGISVLEGWKLVFKQHATIEPCEGRVVPVLIWEITELDEKSLDIYEGYPHYYTKEEMNLTMRDRNWKNPKKITAMVYIMVKDHKPHLPTQSYYDVLAEGYRRFGFNSYLLELALTEAKEAQKNVLP